MDTPCSTCLNKHKAYTFKIRRNNAVQSKASETADPPEYSGFSFLPLGGNQIKGSDSPKYAWSNAECREWLFLFLRDHCGKPEDYSKNIAHAFEGCGPSLWMPYSYWRERLKKMVAWSIYFFLLSAYSKEVRKHGIIHSFEPEKEPIK